MLVAEKMKFNIDDIISAFGAGLEAQPAFDRNTPGFRAVSTDSRTVEEGDLFFAIKGETFDGHDFADGEQWTSPASGVLGDHLPFGPRNNGGTYAINGEIKDLELK